MQGAEFINGFEDSKVGLWIESGGFGVGYRKMKITNIRYLDV